MNQDHPEDEMSGMPGQRASTAWMLTFADLLSLMLTFFVLLYSMSVLESQVWHEYVESLAQRLNPNKKIEFVMPEERGIQRHDIEVAVDLDYLQTIIKQKLKDMPELRHTIIKRLDDRVVISLASDALFPSGESLLTQDAKSSVLLLAEMFRSIGNSIQVNGHTDPNPSRSESYPSNWELSLGRAVSVADALRKSGYTHNIEVLGFGDSRYSELSANLAKADRDALARRVDIVVRETVAQ